MVRIVIIYIVLFFILKHKGVVMKLSILVPFFVLCFSIYRVEATQDSSMISAFQQVKGLVGEWSGHYEWSGARSGEGEIKAVYYMTGNGSSIVENLTVSSSSVVTMTSVYHMDGDDLRMTHYCAAGNQPRLMALSFDKQGAAVDFEMIDITNLAQSYPGHVYKVRLEFQDKDHLIIQFTFKEETGDSIELVRLQRLQ